MRKFNLKSISRTCVSAMLAAVLLASCSELFPNDGQGFVVEDIVSVEPGIAKYHAMPISGKGNLFFRDSAGKYAVGDTLVFTKK